MFEFANKICSYANYPDFNGLMGWGNAKEEERGEGGGGCPYIAFEDWGIGV